MLQTPDKAARRRIQGLVAQAHDTDITLLQRFIQRQGRGLAAQGFTQQHRFGRIAQHAGIDDQAAEHGAGLGADDAPGSDAVAIAAEQFVHDLLVAGLGEVHHPVLFQQLAQRPGRAQWM
ncbi:hypothetical protein D3C77_588300 [compost metagenome]